MIELWSVGVGSGRGEVRYARMKLGRRKAGISTVIDFGCYCRQSWVAMENGGRFDSARAHYCASNARNKV